MAYLTHAPPAAAAADISSKCRVSPAMVNRALAQMEHSAMLRPRLITLSSVHVSSFSQQDVERYQPPARHRDAQQIGAVQAQQKRHLQQKEQQFRQDQIQPVSITHCPRNQQHTCKEASASHHYQKQSQYGTVATSERRPDQHGQQVLSAVVFEERPLHSQQQQQSTGIRPQGTPSRNRAYSVHQAEQQTRGSPCSVGPIQGDPATTARLSFDTPACINPSKQMRASSVELQGSRFACQQKFSAAAPACNVATKRALQYDRRTLVNVIVGGDDATTRDPYITKSCKAVAAFASEEAGGSPFDAAPASSHDLECPPTPGTTATGPCRQAGPAADDENTANMHLKGYTKNTRACEVAVAGAAAKEIGLARSGRCRLSPSTKQQAVHGMMQQEEMQLQHLPSRKSSSTVFTTGKLSRDFTRAEINAASCSSAPGTAMDAASRKVAVLTCGRPLTPMRVPVVHTQQHQHRHPPHQLQPRQDEERVPTVRDQGFPHELLRQVQNQHPHTHLSAGLSPEPVLLRNAPWNAAILPLGAGGRIRMQHQTDVSMPRSALSITYRRQPCNPHLINGVHGLPTSTCICSPPVSPGDNFVAASSPYEHGPAAVARNAAGRLSSYARTGAKNNIFAASLSTTTHAGAAALKMMYSAVDDQEKAPKIPVPVSQCRATDATPCCASTLARFRTVEPSSPFPCNDEPAVICRQMPCGLSADAIKRRQTVKEHQQGEERKTPDYRLYRKPTSASPEKSDLCQCPQSIALPQHRSGSQQALASSPGTLLYNQRTTPWRQQQQLSHQAQPRQSECVWGNIADLQQPSSLIEAPQQSTAELQTYGERENSVELAAGAGAAAAEADAPGGGAPAAVRRVLESSKSLEPKQAVLGGSVVYLQEDQEKAVKTKEQQTKASAEAAVGGVVAPRLQDVSPFTAASGQEAARPPTNKLNIAATAAGPSAAGVARKENVFLKASTASRGPRSDQGKKPAATGVSADSSLFAVESYLQKVTLTSSFPQSETTMKSDISAQRGGEDGKARPTSPQRFILAEAFQQRHQSVDAGILRANIRGLAAKGVVRMQLSRSKQDYEVEEMRGEAFVRTGETVCPQQRMSHLRLHEKRDNSPRDLRVQLPNRLQHPPAYQEQQREQQELKQTASGQPQRRQVKRMQEHFSSLSAFESDISGSGATVPSFLALGVMPARLSSLQQEPLKKNRGDIALCIHAHVASRGPRSEQQSFPPIDTTAIHAVASAANVSQPRELAIAKVHTTRSSSSAFDNFREDLDAVKYEAPLSPCDGFKRAADSAAQRAATDATAAALCDAELPCSAEQLFVKVKAVESALSHRTEDGYSLAIKEDSNGVNSPRGETPQKREQRRQAMVTIKNETKDCGNRRCESITRQSGLEARKSTHWLGPEKKVLLGSECDIDISDCSRGSSTSGVSSCRSSADNNAVPIKKNNSECSKYSSIGSSSTTYNESNRSSYPVRFRATSGEEQRKEEKIIPATESAAPAFAQNTGSDHCTDSGWKPPRQIQSQKLCQVDAFSTEVKDANRENSINNITETQERERREPRENDHCKLSAYTAETTCRRSISRTDVSNCTGPSTPVAHGNLSPPANRALIAEEETEDVIPLPSFLWLSPFSVKINDPQDGSLRSGAAAEAVAHLKRPHRASCCSLCPRSDAAALETPRGEGAGSRSTQRELLRTDTTARLRMADFELADSRFGGEASLLGRGTYGVVRLMRHKPSGRLYAVKSIEKSSVVEAGMVGQVEFELVTQKEVLRHRNILRCFAFLEDRDQVHMILEYCSGGDLYTRIRSQPLRRVDEEEAFLYFAQLINGLHYMHSRCIMHRDLKLENLLLGKDGVLKIADLGWCTTILGKKRNFNFCGTLDYLAPEMVRGDGHDWRVDLWGAGILLYEMLDGKPPFQSTRHLELVQQILKAKINLPPHVSVSDTILMAVQHISSDAGNLIEQLLQYDPEDRIPLHAICQHTWVKRMWRQLKKRYYDVYPTAAPAALDLCSSSSASSSSSRIHMGGVKLSGGNLCRGVLLDLKELCPLAESAAAARAGDSAARTKIEKPSPPSSSNDSRERFVSSVASFSATSPTAEVAPPHLIAAASAADNNQKEEDTHGKKEGMEAFANAENAAFASTATKAAADVDESKRKNLRLVREAETFSTRAARSARTGSVLVVQKASFTDHTEDVRRLLAGLSINSD